MGTAALNQAESALETGKTQYETGRKALKSSLNAFNQIYSIIEPINAQYGTIVELFAVAEDMLWGGDIDSGDPHGGSLYQLERAIRNLCLVIENDLPAEEDRNQLTDNTGDRASDGEVSPVGNTPSGLEAQTNIDIESGGSGEMDGGVGGTGNLNQNNEQNPDEGQQPIEPENQEPENQEPEMQEPEAQKQVSDYPDNSKPAGDSKNNGDLFATHGDLSPEPEESGTPLSPNTGEEKDLSGRLNDAIREVIRAADEVEEDVNTITALADSINLPPDILQTVLSSVGVSSEDELRNIIISAIHENNIIIEPDQGEALGQMLQILSDADEVTGSVTDQMEEIRETAGTVDRNTDEIAEYCRIQITNSQRTR